MSDIHTPAIIQAERLGDGLAITFADGKSGLYRSELLYKMLSSVESLPPVTQEPGEVHHQHLDPNDANMTGD